MLILLTLVYFAAVLVVYEYAVLSREGSKLAAVTGWLLQYTCRWWVLALVVGVEIGGQLSR